MQLSAWVADTERAVITAAPIAAALAQPQGLPDGAATTAEPKGYQLITGWQVCARFITPLLCLAPLLLLAHALVSMQLLRFIIPSGVYLLCLGWQARIPCTQRAGSAIYHPYWPLCLASEQEGSSGHIRCMSLAGESPVSAVPDQATHALCMQVYDLTLDAALAAQHCGPRRLTVSGDWAWLLGEFAGTYGIRETYATLAHLRWAVRCAFFTHPARCQKAPITESFNHPAPSLCWRGGTCCCQAACVGMQSACMHWRP